MKPPLWTPPEIDRLDQLAGNIPRSTLARAYNGWARHHGYPVRTEKAILNKIYGAGMSSYPTGDWIRPRTIADLLGLSPEAPRRWITEIGLAAIRDGGRWAIRRADLLAFARQRPHLFTRAPRSALVQLLENEAAVDQIIASDGPHQWDARRVRCVETRREFPSVRSAAKANYVSRATVQIAIRTGGRAAGYHWTWAE